MPPPEVLAPEIIIRVVSQAPPVSATGWNWPAMLSSGIALLALFFSLRAASRGKSLDVRTRRFERLCIQPVESSFAAIDLLFKEGGAKPAAESRQLLTESIADVDITLSHVGYIYATFQLNEVVEVGEEFKDKVFAGSVQPLATFAPEYALWKMSILNALYKGLDREISSMEINNTLKHIWVALKERLTNR